MEEMCTVVPNCTSIKNAILFWPYEPLICSNREILISWFGQIQKQEINVPHHHGDLSLVKYLIKIFFCLEGLREGEGNKPFCLLLASEKSTGRDCTINILMKAGLRCDAWKQL